MTETEASRMTPCCAGAFQMLENSSDDAPTPSMPNVCYWKHAAVDVHWGSATVLGAVKGRAPTRAPPSGYIP
jgi:hypothetical protein